ncbi:unnamed protein product [Callosobruchus maculatus]|uniref:Uncharacterized protein n=1 Tax=Callosobruchus maculatus TaxID=64391 RepID=A0A653CYJ1_CALMS|nr:unnamed protein product [Callosobruchus maculatus]
MAPHTEPTLVSSELNKLRKNELIDIILDLNFPESFNNEFASQIVLKLRDVSAKKVLEEVFEDSAQSITSQETSRRKDSNEKQEANTKAKSVSSQIQQKIVKTSSEGSNDTSTAGACEGKNENKHRITQNKTAKDDDGFETVQRQRKISKKTVIGSAENSMIAAIEGRSSFFISRLSPEVSDEQVKSHLVAQHIHALEVEKLPIKSETIAAFKVVVSRSDTAKVILVASLMALANAGHLLGHHGWGGLGGLGGGFGGGLGGGVGGGLGGGVGEGVGGGVGHGHVVDIYEQAEVRVGDDTHSELAWGEHDRHAEVHRVIHHPVPVVISHHHGHGWGK